MRAVKTCKMSESVVSTDYFILTTDFFLTNKISSAVWTHDNIEGS